MASPVAAWTAGTAAPVGKALLAVELRPVPGVILLPPELEELEELELLWMSVPEVVEAVRLMVLENAVVVVGLKEPLVDGKPAES